MSIDEERIGKAAHILGITFDELETTLRAAKAKPVESDTFKPIPYTDGSHSREYEGEVYSRVIDWSEASKQPGELPGEPLPAGMVKISKIIADFQSIMERFGDTCVYIKPGVSWGATALNRQADDAKAIEETAETFAETFSPEYKELAQQIMSCAISMGWTHQAASPEREIGVPYLKDRADGVRGRYCIARVKDSLGTREYWNKGNKWDAFGEIVLDLRGNKS